MSVVLIKQPKAYDFSGNNSYLEFQCSDYILVEPVYSVNSIRIANLTLHSVITIIYNGITINITAVLNPDNSGNQVYAGRSADETRFAFFNNYHLYEDFEMDVSGDNLILTAKNSGPEFDITSYNITPGVKEVYKEDYGIVVSIFCENFDNSKRERIYHQIIPLFNKETGKIRVQISDKIHDYISNDIRNLNPEIPVTTLIECRNSCRGYNVDYYEVINGNPINRRSTFNRKALHGVMSNRAQITSSLENILQPGGLPSTDRFLKQGPRMVFTRANQPQYLYFFNTRISVLNAELRVKLIFTDATTDVITLNTFKLEENRKYGFNVTFDSFFSPVAHPGKTVESYEVYLTNNTGGKISETRSYTIDRSLKKQIRYFLNWSSFGSLDSRACYGEGSTELQITQSLAEKVVSMDQDIKRGSSFSFNIKSQSRFSVTSGFINKAEVVLWRDFYLSSLKYRLDSGILMPVLLISDTIKEIEDSSSIFATSFEYRYLYEDHAYTEGDLEDSGKFYKNALFYNQTPHEGSLADEDGNTILSEAKYFINK